MEGRKKKKNSLAGFCLVVVQQIHTKCLCYPGGHNLKGVERRPNSPRMEPALAQGKENDNQSLIIQVSATTESRRFFFLLSFFKEGQVLFGDRK